MRLIEMQHEQPLSEDQKHGLVTDWFAEEWTIKKAIGILDDYESASSIVVFLTKERIKV
jgi:hypothetical protein